MLMDKDREKEIIQFWQSLETVCGFSEIEVRNAMKAIKQMASAANRLVKSFEKLQGFMLGCQSSAALLNDKFAADKTPPQDERG
jgi:hypothetical protein